MTAGRKKNRKIRSEKTITPPQKQIKKPQNTGNAPFFESIILVGNKDVNSRCRSRIMVDRCQRLKI
jgi:hypothetical protein